MCLPLSIRDVPPDPSATIRKESIHTGGVWLWNNEAWKPLDARPYQNFDGHVPTQEAEALEAAAGLSLFPRNWRIEERNGRKWLVRPICKVIGEDVPVTVLGKAKNLALIEDGLRGFNQLGWEVNDNLQFGWTKADGLFLLDLSNVNRIPIGNSMYGDESNYSRLLGEHCPNLAEMRSDARSAFTMVLLTAHIWHNYGYKSPRPMISSDGRSAYCDENGKHWLLSRVELSSEEVQRHELILAYRRWWPKEIGEK